MTNAGVAYHFRADEKNISGNTGSLWQATLQTGLDMHFYEDVWIDPVTGTVLDQKYDIQIKVPDDGTPYANLMLRDIVANYTAEAKEGAADTANIQALAQYYQGNDVVVLTLNGAYTDKTVDEQISGQIESVDALTFGSKTLPSILIGGALVSLLAGFYVYYQNGAPGVVSLDEDQAAETTESDGDENDKESDSDEEVTGDEDKREMAIPEDSSDTEEKK